jgi:ElaB/YqjD/DUF883 family membrane-anchored ribosome-binding protein
LKANNKNYRGDNMSENSHVISKEDSKRLVELLDEVVKIIKDHPSDEIERLKNIHKELTQIRARMSNCHTI